MKIKIVIAHNEDHLPYHLIDIGVKPGDIILDAVPVPETRYGAMRFQMWSDEHERFIICTVMEKNYKRI